MEEALNQSLVTMGITYSSVTDTNLKDTQRTANLSLPWQQAEVQSLSERARIVLSQPVAIISLTLCVLSLVANLLSIIATILGPNGMSTHLKLVVSLGASDILLSLSTVSHLLNRIFNVVPTFSTPPEHRLAYACASTAHFALNTMAIVISLLNLLAMAMDHYLAIMSPLHYQHRLRNSNGNAIICVIWFVAFLGGCSVFFADVEKFHRVSHRLNYCEFVQYSDYHGEYLIFAVAFLAFFVILFTYFRIYIEVRRTYRGARNSRLDYARNRKALLTTLLIIGTFAVCWLPSCLFQIALLIQVRVDKSKVHEMYATFLRANRYLNALLLLNALADPIVYAFRLRDVQLGYHRLFQKCCFSWKRKRQSSFRSSMRPTQIMNLNANGRFSHLGCSGKSDKKLYTNANLSCDDLTKYEPEPGEMLPMIQCKTKDSNGKVNNSGNSSPTTNIINSGYSPSNSPERLFQNRPHSSGDSMCCSPVRGSNV